MSVLKQLKPSTPSYAPAVRFAISFLVKSKRLFSARKLYARVSGVLDAKLRTILGNIILHGCFYRVRSPGRLWRHLTHTRDILTNDYGFTPDRATTNILAKAFLGPRSNLKSSQIRVLFDDFIRRGYPAGERWDKSRLPFGTAPCKTPLGDLIDNPQTISFRKHVQPLYNMFIRAFQLRNDRTAAKTVVAIIKEERCKDVLEKEKRNRARREGIIRKKAKQQKIVK